LKILPLIRFKEKHPTAAILTIRRVSVTISKLVVTITSKKHKKLNNYIRAVKSFERS
jgi:hypothetical protein